jgi:hypothetical protein
MPPFKTYSVAIDRYLKPSTWTDEDIKPFDLTLTVEDLVNRLLKDDKPAKRLLPPIRHVQFNEETGHTAIVWDDGSEATVVRCGDSEEFEPYAGFCAAIVKKLFGSTTAAKRAMEELDVDKAAARKAAEQKRIAEERRAEEERNHKRKVRSMAKRINLWKEAAELVFDDCDLEDLLNTGDKDGDPDGNAV